MQKSDDVKMPERHLKVTPLDLRQPKFKTVMRGFDREEVTAFLLEIADDYENALRENDRLRQELVRLEAAINQHRELEGSLKATLMSAQKVADDMRETANLESGRIVRDAESRADIMMQKAQARIEDVQREIDSLRLKRREAETSIEATISTLRNTLEFVREQDQRDEKVVAHRPRSEAR
jgi:cell division initiation protein